MPGPLLDRYKSGEHREVWEDLLALGGAVREDGNYAPAVEVAVETMRRARHNVESVIVKLEKLGYEFTTEPSGQPQSVMMGGGIMDLSSLMEMALGTARARQQTPFAPQNNHERALNALSQGLLGLVSAGPFSKAKGKEDHRKTKNAAQGALQNPNVLSPCSAPANLDEIEEIIGGPLPVSLREWYVTVGAVNLMGVHEVLNPAGGSETPDPLVLDPIEHAIDFYEDESGDGIKLALAPDALHKAHTSGGDPYSMRAPNPAADGLFEWDGPKITFVEYLRHVFAWGGFPGWERAKVRPQKEIDYLKADLLPL